ncbi:hypothetical protein F5883DRAFT_579746, partial [Diaporthe sp. PMI_573]
MSHFAQYHQDVVHVVQAPIRSRREQTSHTTLDTIPAHLSLKRLIVFLVQDKQRDHYCLAWYDQKHRERYLLDSHQSGYMSMSDICRNEMGLIINAFLERAGCAQPVPDITPVQCAPQSEPNRGALHTINNLRMRLLESDEPTKRGPCSGYVDW